MKPEVVIGVDNGISGGIVALSSFNGSVIDYTPMPIFVNGDKDEVCVNGVTGWLDEFRRNSVVVIEEPLRHAKTSQSMRSMSISFGKMLGLCEALKYPVYRMQVKEWQDVELGKSLAKGQTKKIALMKAQQYWPDESWFATARSRTPHDGIVDAALIAKNYLRCKL